MKLALHKMEFIVAMIFKPSNGYGAAPSGMPVSPTQKPETDGKNLKLMGKTWKKLNQNSQK